ncbi:hypothetical protein ACJX0J_005861 [Zea mays]
MTFLIHLPAKLLRIQTPCPKLEHIVNIDAISLVFKTVFGGFAFQPFEVLFIFFLTSYMLLESKPKPFRANIISTRMLSTDRFVWKRFFFLPVVFSITEISTVA